ncbi:MAG TPA: hypothetical protein VF164_09070, partial [Trueperaceae bacterium]
FTQGWKRIEGARLTYLLMALAALSVSVGVALLLNLAVPAAAPDVTTTSDGDAVRRSSSIVSTLRMPVGAAAFTTSHNSLIGSIVSAVVSALFAGAFTAFALCRALGLDVNVGMLFKYARYFLPIFLLTVAGTLAALLVPVVGPWLTIIAILAGTVAFAFTQLFIVDRDLGPLQALEASMRVVARNVWQTAKLLLIGAILGLGVSLPMSLVGTALPLVAGIALGLATAAATTLVQGVMAVALACAYDDAVGMSKTGAELPIGAVAAAPTLSSGA